MKFSPIICCLHLYAISTMKNRFLISVNLIILIPERKKVSFMVLADGGGRSSLENIVSGVLCVIDVSRDIISHGVENIKIDGLTGDTDILFTSFTCALFFWILFIPPICINNAALILHWRSQAYTWWGVKVEP